MELYALDVTAQVSMPPVWVELLGRLDSACARAARAMLEAYGASYAAHHAGIHPLLHDACPVARLLEPALFRGETWSLGVVCEAGEDEGAVHGQRLVAGGMATGRAPCEVMFEVDAGRLLALTAESIARLP
jgi:purine nucleosidase